MSACLKRIADRPGRLRRALGRLMMRRFLRSVGGLVLVVLGFFMSACGSLSGSDSQGQILVVDSLGSPIAGALVVPYAESQQGTPPRYTDWEIKEGSTNAQGMVSVRLDEFYWDSDGCYHIHVHRAGYEDETMTVSKDLIPPVLKIDLRRLDPAANPRRG